MYNRNYTLPHPLDRPGQMEAFEQIMSSTATYNIVEGDTGIGKSAWVAASSIAAQFIPGMPDLRTMVLTKTKSLQEKNYLESYGFDTLKGKDNYPCGKHKGATAESCPEDICNGEDCPYQIAYNEAVESDRLSLNNAKYLIDPFITQKHQPDIVWIDECHLIPSEVIEFSGATLEWATEYWIVNPQEFYGIKPDVQAQGRDIIGEMYRQLISREPDKYTYNLDGDKIRNKEHIEWERMGMRLLRVSGPQADFFYEGTLDTFSARPLTAKYRFRETFGQDRNHARKIVLMSATPGNPEYLAHELGIEDDYEFIKMPNFRDAKDRQVEVLPAPRIFWNQKERGYDSKAVSQQVKLIADTIKGLAPNWTGVLFTTSVRSAQDMQCRLSGYGINVFVPSPGKGTDVNLNEWERARASGRYNCVAAWNFQEGVDLRQDNYSFVTKIAWPFTGDEYGKARKAYSPDSYKAEAACHTQQCCGRLRRVNEDFGPGVKRIFIVDASVKGIENYFSPAFKESLVYTRNKPGPLKVNLVRK